MKIFYDSEFTGLHQHTTPISMGFVAETGETFYAEFTDYAFDQCNDWIKENVLKNLVGTLDEISSERKKQSHTFLFGNRREVGIELEKWLLGFDDVQIVSDVAHYDFVLFIQLWGHAFNIPKNVSPTCHDINQDIARYLGVSDKAAFDVNREDFCGLVAGEGDKHNALWDAKVIKACYEKIDKFFKTTTELSKLMATQSYAIDDGISSEERKKINYADNHADKIACVEIGSNFS